MKSSLYLSFNGTAREALNFYAELFGGTVTDTQKFADGPDGHGVAPDRADMIAHARLEFGGQVLLASDVMQERDYVKPRGFNIQLDLPSAAEVERVFQALSRGGEIHMPLTETYWATAFCVVRDRFDVPWMLNCPKHTS